MPSRPSPPENLAAAGRRLWSALIGDLDSDWELDSRELHLLERACRCADEMAILEKTVDSDGPTVKGSRGQTTVHPALSEVRQLRLVQLRLLSTIETADPKIRTGTPAQGRGRRAAQARWGRAVA